MSRPVTAVIVGASSGIGRATARLLAGDGARLVLVARDRERLEAVADECRRAGAVEVVVHSADVARADAVEAVLADAVARFGRLDLVVQSAAVMAYGRIEDLPVEVFDTVVDVTVKGTANLARATLPRLRAQDGDGTLVIVTSLLASVPVPTIGAYITAKWGQAGLARSSSRCATTPACTSAPSPPAPSTRRSTAMPPATESVCRRRPRPSTRRRRWRERSSAASTDPDAPATWASPTGSW